MTGFKAFSALKISGNAVAKGLTNRQFKEITGKA